VVFSPTFLEPVNNEDHSSISLCSRIVRFPYKTNQACNNLAKIFGEKEIV